MIDVGLEGVEVERLGCCMKGARWEEMMGGGRRREGEMNDGRNDWDAEGWERDGKR